MPLKSSLKLCGFMERMGGATASTLPFLLFLTAVVMKARREQSASGPAPVAFQQRAFGASGAPLAPAPWEKPVPGGEDTDSDLDERAAPR